MPYLAVVEVILKEFYLPSNSYESVVSNNYLRLILLCYAGYYTGIG